MTGAASAPVRDPSPLEVKAPRGGPWQAEVRRQQTYVRGLRLFLADARKCQAGGKQQKIGGASHGRALANLTLSAPRPMGCFRFSFGRERPAFRHRTGGGHFMFSFCRRLSVP